MFKIPNLHPYSWAAIGLVILVTLWLLIWLVGSPGREAATAAKANAEGQFADGRTESAKGAAVITDEASKGAQSDEAISRENADAIRDACPGPECNRTALRRLCNREAYRNSDDCVAMRRAPSAPGSSP